MNNKNLVSIIIPIFNSERYIKDTIDSILSQTYTNFEIICVDDGSKDKSYSIIKHMSEIDKRIICIQQDNMGNAKARETGCKYISGDYTVFIDSDDLFYGTESLEKMVSLHSKNNAVCTGFNFKPMYDVFTFKLWIKYSLLNSIRIIIPFIHSNAKNYNWYLWAKIFNSDFIKKSKWSNLNRAVDKQFFIDNKVTIKIKRKKVILYRVRTNSVMRHK